MKPILGFGPRMPLRTIAMDAAPAGFAPRKPSAPASAPARKPMASTTPSASPRPAAPKKPAADSPSRQEGLQAILDFLAGHLEDETFLAVEQQLKRSVLGSGSGGGTAYAPAADRRPRLAGDASGERGFFARFPNARRIRSEG
jgi:hypothetical protein